MNAMLVIKTKNGYAIAEYTGDLPMTAIDTLHIATVVEDSSWGNRGKTVADVLKAHFEPPETAALRVA